MPLVKTDKWLTAIYYPDTFNANTYKYLYAYYFYYKNGVYTYSHKKKLDLVSNGLPSTLNINAMLVYPHHFSDPSAVTISISSDTRLDYFILKI